MSPSSSAADDRFCRTARAADQARDADSADRAIGEQQVRGHAWVETRLYVERTVMLSVCSAAWVFPAERDFEG